VKPAPAARLEAVSFGHQHRHRQQGKPLDLDQFGRPGPQDGVLVDERSYGVFHGFDLGVIDRDELGELLADKGVVKSTVFQRVLLIGGLGLEFLQPLVLACQQPKGIEVLGKRFPDRQLLFQAHAGESLRVNFVVLGLVAQAFKVMLGFVGQQNADLLVVLVKVPGDGFMIDARRLHQISKRQVQLAVAGHPVAKSREARWLVGHLAGPPERWWP